MATRRTKEDKLYQAVLDQCVEGIEQLNITKKRAQRTTLAANLQTHLQKPTTTSTLLNNDEDKEDTNDQQQLLVLRAASASVISSALPATDCKHLSQSDAHHPSLIQYTDMQPSHWASGTGSKPDFGRSSSGPPLFGPPPSNAPTGPAALRSGDGMTNVAAAPIQPAQPSAGISLRKRVVRIVGAASPVATTAGTIPPQAHSPAAGPVQQVAKVRDCFNTESAATSQPTSLPASSNEDSEIDRLFARLQSFASTPAKVRSPGLTPSTPKLEPQTPAVAPSEEFKPAASDRATAFTDNIPGSTDTETVAPLNFVMSNSIKVNSSSAVQIGNVTKDNTRLEKDDNTRLYKVKATKYVASLPNNSKTVTVDIVKKAAVKLKQAYGSDSNNSHESIQVLTNRLVAAIHDFLKGLEGMAVLNVPYEEVQDNVKSSEGEILQLAHQFANSGFIELDDLNEVIGLCRSVLVVLGSNHDPPVKSSSESKTECDVKASVQSISASKDLMAGVTAWPAQEKREKVAGIRTCVLKGVDSIKDIHSLQALIWGGPLESLAMDRSGNPSATVKFLTPEGCGAYFEATGNGIQLPGVSGSLVTVTQKPGVNSTNDTVNACLAQDITRCVRALNADDDWSHNALMTLARGHEKKKREVDVIKSGTDSLKRFYIEFRFANIYDSINFKRGLMNDEEWEACTIVYVPDPCATAQGPHFDDVGKDNGKLIGKGVF